MSPTSSPSSSRSSSSRSSSSRSSSSAAGAGTTFAGLGVPANIVAALTARDITVPSPIQALTLPDSLEGRDVSGRAPTGSGKTLAFGLPLLTKVGTATPKRPRGLVLVPTRELASQVALQLSFLGKNDGPWVEAFYGGVGLDRQINWLRRGVDVMVATPGRLGDLIQQRACHLGDVDFVVIDEADRMADMGFLPEVRQLLDQCSPRRQTLLFSATLDGDVDVLVKKYQKDPVRHEVHDEDEGDDGAEHFFWSVSTSDRLEVTGQIIARTGPTIVFSRTKHACDRIARQLGELGVTAAAIHGDRTQAQRERALRSFHKGEVQALVATDVAARGIHVDGVACVVHYDPPADPKDYVHRSGRTARAGANGVVVTLVLPDKKKDVARLMRLVDRGDAIGPVEIGLLPEGAHIRRIGRAGSKPSKATASNRTAPTGRTEDRTPAKEPVTRERPRTEVLWEDRPQHPEGTRSQRSAKAAKDGAWSTTRPEPRPAPSRSATSGSGSGSGSGDRTAASTRANGKPERTGDKGRWRDATAAADPRPARPAPEKAKPAQDRPSRDRPGQDRPGQDRSARTDFAKPDPAKPTTARPESTGPKTPKGDRPSGAARRKAKKLALAAAIAAGEAVPEAPKRARRKPPSAPGTTHARNVRSRRKPD